MPMPIPHNLTIRPNAHAGRSPYQFEVVCSCQWQCLCDTIENAEAAVRFHRAVHKVPDAEQAPDGQCKV
jgi:hypothetical protein